MWAASANARAPSSSTSSAPAASEKPEPDIVNNSAATSSSPTELSAKLNFAASRSRTAAESSSRSIANGANHTRTASAMSSLRSPASSGPDGRRRSSVIPPSGRNCATIACRSGDPAGADHAPSSTRPSCTPTNGSTDTDPSVRSAGSVASTAALNPSMPEAETRTSALTVSSEIGRASVTTTDTASG